MTEPRLPQPGRATPPIYRAEDYPNLDAGIRRAVQVLIDNGVETFESCEGGPGHAFPEPTIRFYGTPEAGWRAVSVCLAFGLPVLSLRRAWYMLDANEPTGPHWEITLRQPLG